MYQNRYEPGIGIIPIYQYRFGIEDMNMGDIGISVSYRFFNVISVSYICIKIGMNPVLVRYRYGGFWEYQYPFEYSPN